MTYSFCCCEIEVVDNVASDDLCKDQDGPPMLTNDPQANVPPNPEEASTKASTNIGSKAQTHAQATMERIRRAPSGAARGGALA